MKHTLRTRLIAGLLESGYEAIAGRSGKYKTFRKADDTMHVGRGGALRRGRTITASASMLDTGTYRKILSIGDAQPAERMKEIRRDF